LKFAENLFLRSRQTKTLQSDGVRIMSNAIVRFVKSSTAVEFGFMAAGLTVSIVAVISTLLFVFGV